jgi:signal transduction histidine kinase/DNA-binding LacI/PurR family transcriptional regulator
MDGDFQLALYNSISREAAALGMDLVCLQGEMFREFSTPKHYPFDSAFQAGLDGILVPSSIIFSTIARGMLPILRDIAARIPLVAIGLQLFDFPSVVIDNQKPLEELIHHLVVHHGYRKLFYLGGESIHPHSVERETTFRNTIQAMKEQFPDLSGRVSNVTFDGIAMDNSFHDYLETNRDDPPDCILGGNDIIAIHVLEALQEQGDPRWRTCPVTGFDDVIQAQFTDPPLTTIRQPLDAMGCLAVRALHDLIRGKPVPETIRIVPELVIRQSCGCAGEEPAGDTEEPVIGKSMPSPYYTQPVNTLGHSLVLIQSYQEMARHLRFFLDVLFIKHFYIILYTEPIPAQLSDTALVVYRRKNHQDEDCFDHPQTVDIHSFFNDLIREEGDLPQAWCLYYLQTGNDILGLIIYEAPAQAYTQINSCAIFIANTVTRLHNLEGEKERAWRLEQEVDRRTRKIRELNEKLREEARHRQEMEAEVLRISEQERLRFSMDLHDDICQRLAGISMYCQSHIVGGEADPFLRELADQIDETLRRTRRYAHDSAPMELDALGLDVTLGSLCDLVNKETSCRCTYDWTAGDISFLTRAQEINICRIVQEALHNVVKHSHATEASVEVFAGEDGLGIQIQDNGRGMPDTELKPPDTDAPHKEGLGLRSMEYRAHQVGATYTCKSAKGQGVCIELHIRRSSDRTQP